MALSFRSKNVDSFLRKQFAGHLKKEDLSDDEWDEFVRTSNQSLKYSRYADKVQKKFNQEERKHGR